MPELPEVETVVRLLAPQVQGRRITNAKILRASCVAGSPCEIACVLDRRIERVYRRGKFVRIELDQQYSMAIHLRMTGWLGVVRPAELARLEDPYIRLWFELDGGAAFLLFRDVRAFGRVWCGPSRELEQHRALAQLGPEPLELDADSFAESLRSRSGRLKPILLNQRFLAGVGNIYADEALFAAALHPLTRASQLTRAQALALHLSIQRVLKRAIKAGGTTVRTFSNPEGRSGNFQRKLYVYGRQGQPCYRCRLAIKRVVIAQRGTWFCPNCQKKT